MWPACCVEGVLELGAGADGLCHLQGDVGPTGPRGSAGAKGEPVSGVGSVQGEQVEAAPAPTSDPSTHRAPLAWLFLETLAPRGTLETG